VNGDVPTAQDVTQAVFTQLAHNAPRLTQHASLSGWLFTSTRYCLVLGIEYTLGTKKRLNQLSVSVNRD
jgi:hypothetical protein